MSERTPTLERPPEERDIPANRELQGAEDYQPSTELEQPIGEPEVPPAVSERLAYTAREFGADAVSHSVEIDFDVADDLPSLPAEGVQEALAVIAPEIAATQRKAEKKGWAMRFIAEKIIEPQREFQNQYKADLQRRAEERHRAEAAITIDVIKQQYVSASIISNTLHFFWPSMGMRFDNYLVRRANRTLTRVTQPIADFVEGVGEIPNPQLAFLDEMQRFYQGLIGEDDEAVRDFAKPRRRLGAMARQAYEAGSIPKTGAWLSAERFPLLSKLPMPGRIHGPDSPKARMLPGRQTALKVATPEAIRGLENFLRQHGRLEPGQAAQLDSFNSLTRTLLRPFVGKRLSAAPDAIAHRLEVAYNALPHDGKDFARDIYGLCEKVVRLSDAGHDHKSIVQSMARSLQPKEK